MNRIACIALLLGALEALGGDKSNAVAIVANPNSPLENVSLAELAKYIKLQKSKAPDGSKITVVYQEAGRPERQAVLDRVLQMSDADLGRYFLQATFTGAISAAPKALPDGESVARFIAATPGSMGYMRASEVGDAVKTIKVDGKSPGDEGYPIFIK